MIVVETKRIEIGDLAERIKNAIERCQKKRASTFKSIAEKIGMSTNNLYRIQNGLNRSINLEQLLKIEAAILLPEDYPEDWTKVHDKSTSLLIFRSKSDLPLLSQNFLSGQPQSEEEQD